MDFALLIDRVAATCPTLQGQERTSAERVVAVCRELEQRPRVAERLSSSATDIDLKRELRGLMETLGRRASHALPAATLARAALADLGGDVTSFRMFRAECEAKLGVLGW